MKPIILLMLFAFLFLPGCAIAVGENAQAGVGNVIVEEGGTAVIGMGNETQTTPEPMPARRNDLGVVVVGILSATGLIGGLLLGLWLVGRDARRALCGHGRAHIVEHRLLL